MLTPGDRSSCSDRHFGAFPVSGERPPSDHAASPDNSPIRLHAKLTGMWSGTDFAPAHMVASRSLKTSRLPQVTKGT